MDIFDQEIINEFVIEANELLSSAEEDIIDLEETSDKETINRIFRAFHTVKGNAAMIGLEVLSSLAHHAEDSLSKVRNETLTPDKEMIDLLLKVVDSLKAMLEDTKVGVEPDTDVSSLVRQLEELDKKGETETEASNLQPDAITLSPKSETPSVPTPTPKPEKLKILVAEDDYTSRKVIKTMLKIYGHVDGVVNGEEAVEAFQHAFDEDSDQPYHLICMDIMMPELDGMEAVKQIRQFEKEKGIALTDEAIIIMTTALDDPKTVIRSLYKCGATAYLVKPVQKDDLEKELRKFGLI